jgi:hypothetical protein
VLEGNAAMLTNYFQTQLDKEDLRVAFFGSHYLNDVRATYDFNHRLKAAGSPARWECFGLIPELNHSLRRWGPSLDFDRTGNKIKKSFFLSEMSSNLRYAVSNCSEIKHLTSNMLTASAGMLDGNSNPNNNMRMDKETLSLLI